MFQWLSLRWLFVTPRGETDDNAFSRIMEMVPALFTWEHVWNVWKKSNSKNLDLFRTFLFFWKKSRGELPFKYQKSWNSLPNISNPPKSSTNRAPKKQLPAAPNMRIAFGPEAFLHSAWKSPCFVCHFHPGNITIAHGIYVWYIYLHLVDFLW